MKNITKQILAVLVITTYACNDTSKNSAQLTDMSDAATVAEVKANPVLADTIAITPETKDEMEIAYTDSINFEKYEVGVQKRASSAPIDWTSYPEARDFKTRITEAYKTNDVNFAGHYIISIFGCGASCIMGYMVDTRDGKIYDLPLGEENSCLFAEDRALYHNTSRLFVSGICKKDSDATAVYYNAYLWNEEKKEFEKIEAPDFLKNSGDGL